MKCKLFHCTDHDTFYPVGGASIVIAKNVEHAQKLLDEALESIGLKGNDSVRYCLYEVEGVKIKTKNPHAIILCDGNY
jgi:hypothetical protein